MKYAKLMTKQIAGVAVLWGLFSPFVMAQDSSGQQATPNAVSAYNEGVSLYEQGQFSKAAEQFNESAKAVDRDLASRARFNLGNTHYAQALASIEAKPGQPGGGTDDAVTAGPSEEQREAAVAHLRAAIQHYRSVLRLNPREQDARANIELAGQMISQLIPPPQQRPPDTTPEESDSSDSSPEDQESQQDDDSDSFDDENKEKDQEDDDQQAESKDQDEQSSDEQSSDGQSSDEQSSDEQSSDEQSSDGQSSDEQSSDSTPRGELSSVNPDESSEDSPTGSAVSPQQEMGMSQEEARKLLQSIRDRDLIRRLRRQARLRSQRVPVERDW
ncbi:MAG: hypothetical protein VYA84_21915 [Planctomycetota bacterium]|nr:hypothetical protein [Planctomycetota bacterium]